MLFLESDNSRIREVRGAHRGSLGFARDDKGECGAFRGDWFVDEGNSRSLRSGRDDNSVCALRVCYGGFGKSEGRTADPSASLGMTKGSAVLSGEIGLWMRGTAGPSASGMLTRDRNTDELWVGEPERSCIEPLRLLVWRDAASSARRTQQDH